MKFIGKQVMFLCCLLGGILVADQSFVIKKEKKRKGPSMNTLKEQYAHNAGDLIKMVPKVEKHLVSIHKKVITDLDDLLNNTSGSHIASLSKEQLDERSRKVALLTQQLEKFDEQLKEIKSSLSSVKTN